MGWGSGPVTEAFSLLVEGDGTTVAAISTSLQVSGAALAGATVVGVPVGVALALVPFPGRRWVRVVLRALQAMPTVVIGLVLFGLLSRSGPGGNWGLLFTRTAMALGQALLILPIVVCLVDSAVSGADHRVLDTALTLGAGRLRAGWTLLSDRRAAVVVALVSAFGRAFSEVGISAMVGGNIAGRTRNLTTGILLETGKGEFARGLALGVVLLAIALGLNVVVQVMEGRDHG